MTTKLIVEEVKENKDGSATMIVDMDNETQLLLIKSGMDYFFNMLRERNKGFPDKKKDVFSEEIRTIKLSNEEMSLLIELAVVEAVKLGMKKDEK